MFSTKTLQMMLPLRGVLEIALLQGSCEGRSYSSHILNPEPSCMWLCFFLITCVIIFAKYGMCACIMVPPVCSAFLTDDDPLLQVALCTVLSTMVLTIACFHNSLVLAWSSAFCVLTLHGKCCNSSGNWSVFGGCSMRTFASGRAGSMSVLVCDVFMVLNLFRET